MWESPSHWTATGIARPVRVAYLVDLADCPDELLNEIFAESYSRWGGRRTLIIPTTARAIDERYDEWLRYFDPDIIYSFVSLSDEAVEALHERFAPAYLTRHQDKSAERGEARSFKIKLPFAGLPSLSVLPAFLARNWGFDGRPTEVTILSKYWDSSKSLFLEENFGFLSKSFSSGLFATSFPELFNCLTLITAESLTDPRQGKEERTTYEVDEDSVLQAIGKRNWLLPLVNLSEMFAPYLNPELDMSYGGMNIVAGDTPADRLLFWNGHHRFRRPRFHEITSIRLPTDRLDDQTFIKRVRDIIKRRGIYYRSGPDVVTLRSCSLDQGSLEAAADKLRKTGDWLAVRVERHDDPAWAVPSFPKGREVFFTRGGAFSEPEGRASTEFRANRVFVPRAMPWHMSEMLPPAGLRHGNWMVDVTIERLVDHCRYLNQRHVWAFPRRLRLERGFEFSFEPSRPQDSFERIIRPMRTGALGLALTVDMQTAVLTTPADDLDALHFGICNNFEWVPFDRGRENGPHGRTRFYQAMVSDKGRYLLGVLQLFERVPRAFAVLMDGFWRDILHRLGASPVEKRADLSERLIATLRKRLGQRIGALKFETNEQLDRLAREALRIGRMFPRERRQIEYRELKEQWLEIVDKFLNGDRPKPKADDEAYYRNERHLSGSIQYLCQREVLFQGREWQCRICFNRNWVSVEALGRTMTCEVCGRNEPAPVSGDWQFRANSFLLDAYREHGTEALVWALWQLSDRARGSFYFAPSLKLWLARPASDEQQCDVEIDAVAVVDGLVYMVEATMAGGLDDDEIAQLVIAAESIRPDLMLVVCLPKKPEAINRLATRIRAKLSESIQVEVLAFVPEKLNRNPFLPN